MDVEVDHINQMHYILSNIVKLSANVLDTSSEHLDANTMEPLHISFIDLGYSL